MIASGRARRGGGAAGRGLDPDLPAMKAVGVPELLRHLRGEIALDEAVAAGAAGDPALRQAPDDLVPPSDARRI